MENYPNSLSVVFEGMSNIEYLKSLARIHNRLDWDFIYASYRVGCKGMPNIENLSVERHDSLIEFEPWGRLFMLSERLRLSTRLDYIRVCPEVYLQGRLGPGEYYESSLYITGYHRNRWPLEVSSRSYWHCSAQLAYDYYDIYPDPTHAVPMMVQVKGEIS